MNNDLLLIYLVHSPSSILLMFERLIIIPGKTISCWNAAQRERERERERDRERERERERETEREREREKARKREKAREKEEERDIINDRRMRPELSHIYASSVRNFYTANKPNISRPSL